jgi:hypothetical protein
MKDFYGVSQTDQQVAVKPCLSAADPLAPGPHSPENG